MHKDVRMMSGLVDVLRQDWDRRKVPSAMQQCQLAAVSRGLAWRLLSLALVVCLMHALAQEGDRGADGPDSNLRRAFLSTVYRGGCAVKVDRHHAVDKRVRHCGGL